MLNRSFYIRNKTEESGPRVLPQERSSSTQPQQDSQHLTTSTLKKPQAQLPKVVLKRPFSRFSKERYLKTELAELPLSIEQPQQPLLDIEQFFKESRFDFHAEIAKCSYLPLEHFEDHTLQKHSDEVVVEMLEGKKLPIQVMEQSSMGQWFWYRAKLVKYSKLFVYQRAGHRLGRCARIHFLLDFEDPNLYLKKLKYAFHLRQQMDRVLRFNCYIDNMPNNDLPAIQPAQLGRISAMLRFPKSQIAQEVESVIALFHRVQNILIFERYLKTSIVVQSDLVKLFEPELAYKRMIPDDSWKPRLQLVYSEGAILQKTPVNFASLQHSIAQTSLITIKPVAHCLQRLRAQMMEFVDIDLFQYQQIHLDQFKYIQEQSVKNVLTPLKNDWMQRYLDLMRKQLKIQNGKSGILSNVQLDRFFLLVRTQLQDFILMYIKKNLIKFVVFLQKITPEEVFVHSLHSIQNVYYPHQTPQPALWIKLVSLGEDINYTINPSTIKQQILNLFDKIFIEISCILDPEPALLENYFKFGSLGFLKVPTGSDDWFQELLPQVDAVYSKIKKTLSDYLIQSNPLKQHLCIDPVNLEESEKSLDQLKNLIMANRENKVGELPESVHVGAFTVQLGDLIHSLKVCVHQREQYYLDLLQNLHLNMKNRLIDEFQVLELQIREIPKNIEQLVEKVKFIKESLPEILQEKYRAIEVMKLTYSMLEEYLCNQKREELYHYYRLMGMQLYMSRLVNHQLEYLDKLKGDLYIQQFQDQTKFIKLLKDLDYLVFQFKKIDKQEQLQEAVDSMQNLKGIITRYQQRAVTFNKREELFGMQITSYAQLNQLAEEFEPFHNMWHVFNLWHSNKDRWFHAPIQEVSGEDCEQFAEAQYRLLIQAINKLPEKSGIFALACSLKSEVDAFKSKVPILLSLKKKGIRQRHIQEIGTLLKSEVSLEKSLSDFLQLQALTHVDALVEIGLRANEEARIEELLLTIKHHYRTQTFMISPHKNTIILKNIEEVQIQLDEHLVSLEQMIKSRYNEPFKEESMQFYEQLKSVSNILEEWLQLQSQWLYFLPIFESFDISKQLPVEYKKFRSVDKSYRQLASQVRLVLSLLNQDTQQIIGLNAVLQQIHKELGNYLDRKKEKFPRFFFLSSDELLEIVSKVQDPKQIQPYLNRLFENVTQIGFTNSMVTIMYAGKESCPLVSYFNTVGKNVEDWLQLFEQSMRETINKLIVSKDESIHQLQLLKHKIQFTQQIDSALSQGESLDTHIQLHVVQLASQRNTAYIMLLLHELEVLRTLKATKDEFLWQSQIRYYIQDQQCVVNSLFSSTPYGNEFLTTSQRLVLTPLTNRCHLIYLNAFSMRKGALAVGPTGTGKSETIKELSKLLAYRCLIFNCSPLMDYLIISNYVKGLTSSTCWACFDEVNLMAIEVLSVMSSLINHALLQKPIHLFATMNPHYSGRTALPENLQSQFRCAAMLRPDFQPILETTLYSMGYKQGPELTTKLLALFDLCETQLTKRNDYSLRTLKSIIQPLSEGVDEAQNIVNSIKIIFEPRLVAEDLLIFQMLLQDAFPQAEQCQKDAINLYDYTETPIFKTKVAQLDKITRIRHGNMLIGPTGTGKSSAIDIVARNQSKRIKILFPKAVKIQELYGCLNLVSQEWTEGILAKQLCQSANSFLVFDGPVETEWIETLNTVLDDSRKLCLSNGQIICLPDDATLIFEAENIANATPATISRCGLVYMDDTGVCIAKKSLSRFSQKINTLKLIEQSAARAKVPVQAVQNQLIKLLDIFQGNDEQAFVYCLAWAILPLADNKEDRNKCDEFLKSQIGASLPDLLIYYDQQFNPIEVVNQFREHLSYHQIQVETKQSAAYSKIGKALLNMGRHLVFVGQSSVGKSSLAERIVQSTQFIKVNYSASRNSSTTQAILEMKLDKRRKGVLGPQVGQKCAILLEDMHMPQECELIRQFVSQQGWYSKKDQNFQKVEDTSIVATSQLAKNTRLLRHFILLNLLNDPAVFERIFTILTSYFQLSHLVPKTLQAFKSIKETLLPTPRKVHYQFTMRDVWKVFQSLCTYRTGMDQQWTHDMSRIFCDRLTTKADKLLLNSIIGAETVQFCDFNSGFFADRSYKPVRDQEAIKSHLKEIFQKQDFPIYEEAIQVIMALSRTLSLPDGHCIVIGGVGTGGYQLAQMAVIIRGLTRPIMERWRDDLKHAIQICLQQSKAVCIAIEESQVSSNQLDDLSSLMNSSDLDILSKVESEECFKGISQKEVQRRFRENFHAVLVLSQINLFRQYPTFVSCATIVFLHQLPEPALHQIAQQHLSSLDFPHPALPEILRQLHFTAQLIGSHFSNEEKRPIHFTSFHFLDQLKIFRNLQEKKGLQLQGQVVKLREGIAKLLSANEAIQSLQNTLTVITPQIEDATKETKSMMEVLTQQKHVADEQENMLSSDEQEANKQKQDALRLAQEAEKAVEEANLTLSTTLHDVQKLKKEHLVEIKSLGKPPKPVIVILTGLVILNMDQLKQKGGEIIMKTVDQKKEEDFFETAKKHFLNDPKDLLESLRTYDKNNINPYHINRLEKLVLVDPDFSYDRAKQCSAAVKYLFSWVKAMYDYNKVYIETKPLREKLAEAQKLLDEKTRFLNEKRSQLQSVQDVVLKLQSELDERLQQQQQLTNELENCQRKLYRAQQLTNGLEKEQQRWNDEIRSLEQQLEGFQGNSVIAAAFLTYCGPLTQSFRRKLLNQWVKQSGSKLKCELVPIKLLSSDHQLQKWHLDGLPNDETSTENAILIEWSHKNCFCIDPHSQANKFLRRVDNIIVVNNLRALEVAFQMKQPILLENVNNIPRIERKEGAKIYITTTQINPQFTAEQFCNFAIINFSLTHEGCREQMLNLIVQLENPNLHMQQISLLRSTAENNQTLMKTEENILNLLNVSNLLDLLDEENLIQQLKASKTISNKIQEAEINSFQTQEIIMSTRQQYQPLADKISNLFFILQELEHIEYVYQFSLEWYQNLFRHSVSETIANYDIKIREKNLYSGFLQNLYRRVASALSEQHQLIFAFLIIRLDFDHHDWNSFVLNGVKSVDAPANPHDWIDQQNFSRIHAELNSLHLNSAKHLLENFTSLKEFYLSTDYHERLVPCADKLSQMQQLQIIKAIRPDYLIQAIRNIVQSHGFPTLSTVDFNECYRDSEQHKMIVFNLQQGQDPSDVLKEFAKAKNFQYKCLSISLGQASGVKAEKLIKEAASEGLWVYLQNCHLYLSWINELDRLSQIESHPDFRMWMTTKSTRQFPSRILKNSIKITLKQSQTDSGGLKLSESGARLLNFHQELLRRSEYGRFGFNQPYTFTQEDFNCSLDQIQNLQKTSSMVYLVACLHYGGRVTDPFDQKLLMELAELTLNSPSEKGVLNLLSSTAFIYSGIQQAEQLLSCLRYMSLRDQQKADEKEQVALQVIVRLKEELPQPFDLDQIRLNYPTNYLESMNNLLVQEANILNIAINTMFETVDLTIRILQGDDTIVDVSIVEQLYRNEVPIPWQGLPFQREKTLSSWVQELKQRYNFIASYINDGEPKAIWLGAFVFPRAFITCAKQNHCRKHKEDATSVMISFNVMDSIELSHITSKPDEGCYVYGVYIQGAKWSKRQHELCEADSLYSELPILYMTFVERHPLLGYYMCPLYKNSHRGSDNLITELSLQTTKAIWLLRGVAAFLFV